MKVLVTGGCGFLGSNLAASYLQEGAVVTVIDALFRTGSARNLAWLYSQSNSDSFNFIQADLADLESVLAVFRRYGPFDYICHVGGQVAMTTSLQDPARDFQSNVLGTFNVLEAARIESPKALISFSSTNKVYGDLEWLSYCEMPTRYCVPEYPRGLDESLSLDFSTPYGCSKGAADQYVRDWSRVYGLKTVVFRHSSIYGGRQYPTFDQGWIGWFTRKAVEQCEQIQNNQELVPFSIAGSGKQVRDVLHCSDLVSLYRAAFAQKDKMNGQIFNIGGGVANSLSLLELFNLLSQQLEIPPLLYYSIDKRSSDQDYFVANIDKARKVLGWQPQTSASEGIRDMICWIRSLQC